MVTCFKHLAHNNIACLHVIYKKEELMRSCIKWTGLNTYIDDYHYHLQYFCNNGLYFLNKWCPINIKNISIFINAWFYCIQSNMLAMLYICLAFFYNIIAYIVAFKLMQTKTGIILWWHETMFNVCRLRTIRYRMQCNKS